MTWVPVLRKQTAAAAGISLLKPAAHTTASLASGGGYEAFSMAWADQAVMLRCRVTRTGGTSTLVTVAMYPTEADRDAGTNGYYLFDEFVGATIGADPIYGPQVDVSGFPKVLPSSLPTGFDAETLWLRLYNLDLTNVGTFEFAAVGIDSEIGDL